MTQKAPVVKIPDWGKSECVICNWSKISLLQKYPKKFPKNISQNMTQKAPVAETPDWGRWRCVI